MIPSSRIFFRSLNSSRIDVCQSSSPTNACFLQTLTIKSQWIATPLSVINFKWPRVAHYLMVTAIQAPSIKRDPLDTFSLSSLLLFKNSAELFSEHSISVGQKSWLDRRRILPEPPPPTPDGTLFCRSPTAISLASTPVDSDDDQILRQHIQNILGS